MTKSFIVGIDEAGRGPLAGPVAVAAVQLPRKIQLPNYRLADSKKLTAGQREEWYKWIVAHSNIAYAMTLVGPHIIDRDGIVCACREGVARCLRRLGVSENISVLLDGALKAPRIYKNQETIIKGDEREVSIMLASIIAKVHRDAHMERLAKRYPQYEFEKHKGYGTRKHYEYLRTYDPCPVHRKTFLRKLDKTKQ